MAAPDNGDIGGPHLQPTLNNHPRPALHTAAAADEPPLLELRDVDVRFARVHAVKGVSFALRGGEFLGLLGANGAGKTTLMRVVSGLQSAHAGGVRLLGEPLSPDAVDLLRHIGFTPDTPPLYDGLTVRQFLRFIGRQYQLSAQETDERIDLWLEKLWLTEKADARIKGLSRGMRQRIGIARTLLPNPALVVLDEPAAGLDPSGRVQFRNLLADLRRQGKALIVSSHVLSDLAEQCTHIALMNSGRLERFEPIAAFTGQAHAERCRYRVRFARPVRHEAAELADLPGVSSVAAHDDDVMIEGDSRPERAAVLLAELIRRGLPVSAFAPVEVNLEEAYLRASDHRVR